METLEQLEHRYFLLEMQDKWDSEDYKYANELKEKIKKFKVSKQYWRQAQVEMYASGIYKLYIVAYGLQENDYNNYFNEIDKNRLELINVDYDKEFIENEYLPKLEILTECLKKGVFPE